MFQVNVKCSNEAAFSIQVSDEMTVEDLKARIKEQENIEPEHQRLIYCGRVLKDEATVDFYKIKENSTIHLVRSGIKREPAAPRPAAPEAAAQTPPQPAPQTPQMGIPAAQGLGMGMGMPPSMMNSAMQSAMNNPEMTRQMIDIIAQNPALLDSIMASNPMLQNMPPEFREALRQPEFLRTVLDPNVMALAQNMMANPDYSSLGVHPDLVPAPAHGQPQQQSQTPPEERFRDQLQQLQEMGFFDPQENLQVLIESHGNVNIAIEKLLSRKFQ